MDRPPHCDALVKPGDIIYVQLAAAVEGPAHRATLEQDSGVQGSLMAIDNTSGDVLAMVGGRDYALSQFQSRHPGRTADRLQLQALRLHRRYPSGVKPTDTVLDTPARLGDYVPHDYENNFKGPMTVLNAFAESRNIPALRLASRVGIHTVIDVTHRFGVTSNIPAYLPIAMGAVESRSTSRSPPTPSSPTRASAWRPG